MKIILSPAKQMEPVQDGIPPWSEPVFAAQSRDITERLRSLPFDEYRAVLSCSEALAKKSRQLLDEAEQETLLSPAVLCYRGTAFRAMAPNVFSEGELQYLQNHLRILSGLYGVLRPMDGIHPYRLEMQAPLEISGKKDLYRFWGDQISREVFRDGETVINLASREYARCVEEHLHGDERLISCVFGELQGDKVVQKGLYAKQARGEMVRYMALHRIESPEELRSFSALGYRYDSDRSGRDSLVFVRDRNHGDRQTHE